MWGRIERLPHSADQSSGRKRFGYTPVAAVSTLGIAGDKNHRQPRVKLQNTIREIEAVHIRHHHIGYEQRNVGLVLFENADAFDSIGSHKHGVSSIF